MQSVTSDYLLLRSMQNALVTFVSKAGDQDAEVRKLTHEIATTLLRIRQDNPVLEQSENGNGGFDNDSSEKLLLKAIKDKVPVRDYLRLRSLDQTFYLVITARSTSATAHPQLLTLVNDFVAHSPLSYTNFKTPKDLSNLLALFQLTADDFAVFLGTTTKLSSLGGVDLSTELWAQTFAYLQMSEYHHSSSDVSPEVAVERKGGVQLTTVSFTTDENKAKGAPRGGLRKRELRPKRQQ